MVQVKIETEEEMDGQEVDDQHKIYVEYNKLQQQMELFLQDEMVVDFIEALSAELEGLKFDFTPMF